MIELIIERKVLKMKHKYELRSWKNDDTMTTVLKINDEPTNMGRARI